MVGVVLCPVLVGRRAEIQAVESALAGALAGRGGCAVITGEAGIGKSRLIRELARMAAGRQVLVVTGRAVPASASFLAAVRDIGLPVTGTDVTDAPRGLTLEELDRALAAHGIANVGPPMEQAEAEHLIGQLA